MPTARLATIADPQGKQLAFPMKIGAIQLGVGSLQLAEPRQAREEVGRTAEDLLQVLGGVGGDLAAESAGCHVEEDLPADLAEVDGPWRHIQQRQGLVRLQRDAGSLGEVVGGAQGHQHQAGVGLGLGHGFGHIAQGAVAATGDDVGVAISQGLRDDALGVAALPRDPHRQFPALLTPGLHGCAHVLVKGLLAVED
ncbi:hypothetical protein PS683_05605 [Pseudomonas fluorescens]|uniref:Uncharacterized protein n=1 Tax=Pseudomonas fluorescens TaxID=294 RepID=A0A5E6N0U9_PSEFL|nr:hypothetical protein PS683_05605 [Pseudomonas fluorescens]VVN42759.1 hypothetical protein PS683_05605 [Pseudomonas fluorescens]